MKGYIYFIINQENGKRYVGQTIRYSDRKSDHKRKLNNHTHVNAKLQNAWDKYGENAFIWEKITYDNISAEELDEYEIYYIKKYNSVEDGYNIETGGSHGRGKDARSKLTFDQYAFAYLGNKKYDGMTMRTGNYLGVDSSCISAIRREQAYTWWLEDVNNLSQEVKDKYISDFEEKLDLKNNPPWTVSKTPDADTTLKIICCVSTYGRGIEAAIAEKIGLTKGFVFHFVTGNGRNDIKEKYKSLSKEEIIHIGESYFKELNIQKNIKKKYQNLKDKYPNRPF